MIFGGNALNVSAGSEEVTASRFTAWGLWALGLGRVSPPNPQLYTVGVLGLGLWRGAEFESQVWMQASGFKRLGWYCCQLVTAINSCADETWQFLHL